MERLFTSSYNEEKNNDFQFDNEEYGLIDCCSSMNKEGDMCARDSLDESVQVIDYEEHAYVGNVSYEQGTYFCLMLYLILLLLLALNLSLNFCTRIE